MAKRTKRSGLLGQSLKNHAKDETTYGMDFVDLPGGIRGGIAKLSDAKIGIYQKGDNKGEQFVYLGGVVVQPKTAVNTVKIWKDGGVVILSSEEIEIEGQRTSLMLPLCDTTKVDGTVIESDEHIKDALNELRKLGGEECTEGLDTEEGLADLLKVLVASGIHFKFGTSSSAPTPTYPEPRVWENWHGATDYEPEEDDGMSDATGSDEPEPKNNDAGDDIPFEDEANEVLADKADGGDEEAAEVLAARARDAGIDPDEPANWAKVAEAIAEAAEEKPEPEDDPGNFEPVKGETYLYKPPRKRNPVKCEVTAVFAKKETCNLRNLDTKQSYKSVSWDNLVDVE